VGFERACDSSTADHIGGDARVAHDQGRSLTAIDVSARGDAERRIGAMNNAFRSMARQLQITHYARNPRRCIYRLDRQ
jgi:hypothetical protein